VNDRGICDHFLAGAKHLSLLHSLQAGSEAHPAYYPKGTVSLQVKRQGCDADHIPLPSADVKNGVVVPPLPSHVFMTLRTIKYRDKFTFFTITFLGKRGAANKRS
jgi:hypothetical protein